MTVRSLRGALRRHPYVRIALLSAAAAAVAWTIGSLLPSVSALIATVTALTALHPTFHASAKEALRQVVGTMVGALAAVVLASVAGLGPVTVFVAVVTAYLAARLLRLGEAGAETIAVSALLVAVNLDGSAVEARLLGVALGAVVGLVASWWARPGTPTTRALDRSVRDASRLADLLTAVSAGLAARADGDPVDADAVNDWQEQAESIVRDLASTRDEAEEALSVSRWSPGITRDEAERVLAQVRLHEATAATVLGMCRDLHLAATRRDALPEPVAGPLAEVFAAAADALTQQADAALVDPARPLDVDATVVQVMAGASGDAAARLREVDGTAPLKLGGSLLSDGDEIGRLLTGQ